MIKISRFFLLILFIYSNNLANNLNDKSFVIITPSYNNKDWYQNNLNSIFNQTYKNYRVIYIDDASTDDTYSLVKKYLKKHNKEPKFQLIQNKINQGPLANHYKAINMCKDDEIIVCLDGDDWFADNTVLEKLNKIYQDPNIWMTYSQYNYWPMNKIGSAVQYPDEFVKENKFREFGYICVQGRSYYAWLAKLIKLQDLICDEPNYEGKFFPVAGDVALMFPMLEMCGNRFKFIPDFLIQYNHKTALNEYKLKPKLQETITKKIKLKEKYKKLKKPVKLEKNKKANLIIYSFDNPIGLNKLIVQINKYLNGINKTYVIFKSNSKETEKKYNNLKEKFKKISFIKLNESNTFEKLTFDTLSELKNDFIIFAHDKTAIKNHINICKCTNELQRTFAFGFQLSNCLKSNKAFLKIEDNINAYQIGNLTRFNFYMTIFTKNDVLKHLQSLKFNSLKELEDSFYSKFEENKNNKHKIILCFDGK